MGYYVGDYESISRTWLRMDLTTRYIDETLGTNGVATSEQDSILPSSFLNYVNEGRAGCDFTIHRPKTIRLYRDTDKFLLVIIPWQESSSNYLAFFEEILTDPNILRIEILPEIIRDEELKWLVLLN